MIDCPGSRFRIAPVTRLTPGLDGAQMSADLRCPICPASFDLLRLSHEFVGVPVDPWTQIPAHERQGGAQPVS